MTEKNQRLTELRFFLSGAMVGSGYIETEVNQFLDNPTGGFLKQTMDYASDEIRISFEEYCGLLAQKSNQEFRETESSQPTTDDFRPEHHFDNFEEIHYDTQQPHSQTINQQVREVTMTLGKGIESLIEEIGLLEPTKKRTTLDDIYSAYTTKKGLLYEVFMNSESYLRMGWNLMTKLKETENDDSRLLGKLTVNFLSDQKINRKDFGYSDENPENPLREDEKTRIITLAEEIYTPLMAFIRSRKLRNLDERIDRMSYEDAKDAVLKGVLVYLANNGLQDRYFSVDEIKKIGKNMDLSLK